MISLEIQKRLGQGKNKMLLDVAFRLEKGQFATLYGPSGAGKTSVLRLIAGLMEADSGFIKTEEKCWYDRDKGIFERPQRRNIGFVFQDYALFPNMTVYENMVFAAGGKNDNISKLIDMVGLKGLEVRKPDSLSGGERQRTALARALVGRPELLLLDEPLAALDQKTRSQLQDYLGELHKELGLTTILVSHDIGEISKLSDLVIELDQGRISRKGSPEELFISKRLSGKFKFIGEVLKIERQEIIYVVTVLVEKQLVKVIAQEDEVTELGVGDKVIIASKAFNPIMYKLD